MEQMFVDLRFETVNDREQNIIDSPLLLFLQEVEIAVKMAPGDIWGIYDALDISKYVFNKYITLYQVKSEITKFISNQCAHASLFSWNVNAEFVEVPIDNSNVSDKILHISLEIFDTEKDEKIITQFLVGT